MSLCNSCVDIKNEDNFINLHLHTSYSLLDGMSKIEDVTNKVKKLGQRGFAVTEHGNVHSSVKAYLSAKEHSLKFIYGCEFYICSNRFDKDKKNKYYHLTVLAKNEQGRLNINKLVSLGYLEGFYHKPRIDFDLLSQHSDGLIIMSGCMASELQQTLAGGKIGNSDVDIVSGNIERAKEVAMKYHKVFGDDYYMEVQSHRDKRQQQLNRCIVDIAKDLGIQWVATADSHFVEEDDLELHKIFIAINRSKDSYEEDETYQDTHIQSEKEAWNLLHSLTEEERDIAIRNTSHILDKCNAHMPISAPLIPHVNVPIAHENEDEYLKHLVNVGWKERGIYKYPAEKRKEYMERVQYEFNAISKLGFSGYYLLVYKYANSVEKRGIARGSGGGSLIAYLLKIVDIDPIEHGLYFERFIDVAQLDLLESGQISRKELKIPDFDSDFGTQEREAIVQELVNEHGQSHVAALCQFGYIWDKSAVKDVGRVLGIPFDVTNQITKTMEDDTIEEALERGTLRQYEVLYPKLFEYAKKLAGLPRSYGVHPCGKVVSIDEITYYTAISEKDGEMVVHIDMKDAEALGLVKVDLLGLRTVDILWDTLHMIGKNMDYLRNFKPTKEVWDAFKNGFTDGVFQFESGGMKRTLGGMKPTSVDELSVANALYRPGSMKFIDNYVARKNGEEEFEYLHSDLEEVLKVTYAIIVFQEQLIQIGRLAGLKNPDLLRQATGKKDVKKLAKVEPELRKGLYSRGWSKEQVDELWRIMLDFAKYSFNKSHSSAYALIALYCMILKIYHPVEFTASWLNSLQGKEREKFEVAYYEAKRLGVKFTQPSFRNVHALCKVENGKINYGVSLIKHCNAQIAEDLSHLSDKHYNTFTELLIDIAEYTGINSKQLDIMIRLGYFSEFGTIKQLLYMVDMFTNSKVKYSKTHKEMTKSKRKQALIEFETNDLPDILIYDIPTRDIVIFERDHYGFIMTTFENFNNRDVILLDIDTKYTPKIVSYTLRKGTMFSFKIYKKNFYGHDNMPQFHEGDIIRIKELKQQEKKKKVDDEWVGTGEMEYILEGCKLLQSNQE